MFSDDSYGLGDLASDVRELLLVILLTQSNGGMVAAMATSGAEAPVTSDSLLLETGGTDALLLETGGTDALLLESA